jgi:hypothetical protein
MHEQPLQKVPDAVDAWWGGAMKRLSRLCRRARRGLRMLVLTVDRPRRIDRVINCFGDRHLGAAAVMPPLSTMRHARVCRG